MSKKTTKKKTVNLGEHPREEALANALAQIEKEYGKGAIMKLKYHCIEERQYHIQQYECQHTSNKIGRAHV